MQINVVPDAINVVRSKDGLELVIYLAEMV